MTVEQGTHLVGAALGHVAHPELAHARGHGRRAAAAGDRHRDAALHEQLQAVPVAHVERLERLPARGEVQPPVGEHAIDVEHEQLDTAEGGRPARRLPASLRSSSNDTRAQ